MAESQKAKSGGARKIGRDRFKCERYRNANTRERNKLKRIRQSNGIEAARQYAKDQHLIFREG